MGRTSTLTGCVTLSKCQPSLRLSFLICKMGTLGAAAWTGEDEGAKFLVTQFLTRSFGKVLGVAVRRSEDGWQTGCCFPTT